MINKDSDEKGPKKGSLGYETPTRYHFFLSNSDVVPEIKITWYRGIFRSSLNRGTPKLNLSIRY